MSTDLLDQLTLPELRRRTSEKWRRFGDDVLPLWVAEMDVPLAGPVHRALVEALDRGDTGYPAGEGYADALAAFAAQRWGWDGLEPSRTLLVADVMTGITEVLAAVTEPGSPVVVSSPVYPPFHAVVAHTGRRVVEAPLGEDGRLDLRRLEAVFAATAAESRPAAYLLCNPHNPTGTVPTPEELTALAALAARYGVRVVSDEIHAPLVLPGATFTPYLSVPGTGSAFALLSASKGWNLAGLKAAVLVGGPETAGTLATFPEVVAAGASHLGVLAHTAALREGGGWLDELLVALDARRTLVGELLAAHLPAAGYRAPEGTYLAWLDLRAYDLPDDEDPADALRGRTGVALTSGVPFGTGGAGHVRLNFAAGRATLVDAVERLAKGLHERG
ncbi:MalY/PatB family protein [Cellulomonas endophytica]|uniref:MalY/PatB family protein n=1 Tax=Cellulomonas endophytica TaxID=2494735 RepID=UPI001F0CABDC|nr:aminotransferase class I/II-fold pyridoxal phosphate-dependent enzyme [Cellulomonas endophytica]